MRYSFGYNFRYNFRETKKHYNFSNKFSKITLLLFTMFSICVRWITSLVLTKNVSSQTKNLSNAGPWSDTPLPLRFWWKTVFWWPPSKSKSSLFAWLSHGFFLCFIYSINYEKVEPKWDPGINLAKNTFLVFFSLRFLEI